MGDFLEEFDPDILCLVEHGLKYHEMSHLKIHERFHVISNYCRSNHKSGGALILAKENLNIKVDNNLNSINSEMDMEVTTCLLHGLHYKLRIIVVYRSPKGNLNIFFEKLTELQSRLDPNDKTVILGDFNIDLLINDNNSQSLINKMKESGLEQTVFIPTRVTENTSTLIDNLFTNLGRNNCKIEVIDSALSDHYGIALNIPSFLEHRNKESQGFFARKYSNNIHLIRSNLIDLSNTYPKEEVTLFLQRIVNQHNLHFPSKFRQTSTKLVNDISPSVRAKHYESIKEITNKMHLLRKNTTKFERPTYLELKKKLKETKSNFKQTILKSKADCVKNAISNTDNIAKTTWNIVNSSIVSSKHKKTCKIEQIIAGKNIITDQKEISNVLNDHFVSILNRNSDKIIDMSVFNYLHQRDTVFYINPITVTEIEQAIDRLKNKKSESHDGISNHFLKLIKEAISPLLTYYINQSIIDCNFPDYLKEIKVIPLWKGGDSTNPNHYRPLSLVSPISKIYESVVVKQINKFLKINNILCENQFGFREKLSTEMAIRKCYETICAKKNDPLVVITIDLSKAFDSVNHNILLHKLKKIGFGKNALKWIKSYIVQRKQYVHIKKGRKIYNSDCLIIDGGIAQGSMIGPLLFLLFINDLAKFFKIKIDAALVSFFYFLLFADDILFILSHKLLQALEIDAFILMNYFFEWCKINLLVVNLEKSKYLLFNTKPELCKPFQILLDGEQIERVRVTKYLGVLLDDNFKFDEHIDNICKKLHAAVFVLKTLARFCDLNTLTIVYHALFVSHVQYCINIWSFGKTKKIEKVFNIQKRAIRTILKLRPKDSCREHFKKHQFLTVPAMIIYSSLKLLNSEKSQSIEKSHTHNTRYQKVSSIMKRSPIIARGNRFYSKVPTILKKELEENPCSYNKIVKRHLIQICPYSIKEYSDNVS